jgi:UDP-N-acetylglucosamine--N-acetylmuramyl-(pentapeptide) pyrophosphoryl-undecaprenol N-acetylglucosamine transferase
MIPLRGSGTRGDQVENARIFQEAGLGLGFSGGAGELAAMVAALAADPAKREAMGAAAGRFAAAGASGRIVSELLDRIKG